MTVVNPPARKVFVVGCVRSGTSWVRSTLGAHPGALTTTESHVFHEAYEPLRQGASWESLLEHYDATVREQRPVGVHKWVSREAYGDGIERARAAEAAGLDRVQAAVMVVRAVLDGFAETRGAAGRLIVEKTPTHIFWADAILDHFPEARIVEVVRDGRDACVSMQHRALTESWPPKDRLGQITRWIEAVGHGLAVRARVEARGRWYVAHYEAMKADVVGETSRLLGFCGLSTDARTVADVVEANDFSRLPDTGDGRHQRKGEVGDWRNHFTPEDERLFRETVGDLFERAGYRYDSD